MPISPWYWKMNAEIGLAQPRRQFRQSVQHRLVNVELLMTFENIGDSSLLLQRPVHKLTDQVGIFNRDSRLRSKVCD